MSDETAALFPGFTEHRIDVDGAQIFARVAGSGPPVLLLHGYPQTHACWWRIAPVLASQFTVVAADLRGYGRSIGPPADAAHENYSKRTMANDAVGVMRALGYSRFAVVGHDRGARVAYRLALDHPQVPTRIAVLDILPTLDNWERMRWQSAISAYHWPFLAQPYPLPETLIAADPVYYVIHTLESWTGSKSLDCFAPQALADYRAQLNHPPSLNAVCEDYRAGASLDRERDGEDRAAGRRIACQVQVLWSTRYLGRGTPDPLAVWQPWCEQVSGSAFDCGHFLAEEAPQATCEALSPFLRQDLVPI